MMQHEPGPMLPNALDQETVDSVRRALQHYAQQPASEPAPELRAALHALAKEARRKAVSPEQLLITLKSMWQTLPVVEKARGYDEQTLILQRVVTICIKEYFAE
jgi:hypothetical protein